MKCSPKGAHTSAHCRSSQWKSFECTVQRALRATKLALELTKMGEGNMSRRWIMATNLCACLITGSLSAQNAPAPAPPAPAAAPSSPSAKVGLFVNPKNGQSPEQQAQDENACYSTATQQTGIDPTAAPAPAPEADKKQGGAVKGAAGGAAGGAAVGAIAGDAGTGAAIGATAGAVRGRRQQKKANKQAEQQAQQQAQGQQQQKLDTFRRAFSSCIDSKGYSVK